ncbi:MAG: hypothetical protein WDW36_003500 [Sanguina aurantia]
MSPEAVDHGSTSKSGKPTKGTVSSTGGVQGRGSRFYLNITGFPFPLGPWIERNTVRRQVEKDVWLFEQTQAIEAFDVYTPVRMTVIKLKSGGLWVHGPIAPTQECVRLIRELNAPVEYIVLGTFAYEHKIFVAPFSREFPNAQVYLNPYQWSFPLNLPPQLLGIFPAGELKSDDPTVPWAGEIDQKLFLPPSIGVGDYVRFTETAFFHRRSRSLIVTDAVVFVPEDPPEVIPLPALLENARDNFLARFVSGGLSGEEVAAIARPEEVENTRESRRRGWMRMALLVLYFSPSNLLRPEESFAAVSNRLMVAPVVESLVYSRLPRTVTTWVDEIVAEWDFQQIIPCHFDAPIKAGPAQFQRAFAASYKARAELEEMEDMQSQGTGSGGNGGGGGGSSRGGSSSSPQQRRGSMDAEAAGGGGFASGLALLGQLGTGLVESLKAAMDARRATPIPFPEADMQALNRINDGLTGTGLVKRYGDAPRVNGKGAGSRA